MPEQKKEKPASPGYSAKVKRINVNDGRETKVVGQPPARPEAEKKGGK